MPTRNINLTDHYDQFIQGRVTSGRYKNASEVVRTALRVLERLEEEERLKLETLRREVAAGFEAIDRDDSVAVRDDELDDYVARLGEAAAQRLKQGVSG